MESAELLKFLKSLFSEEDLNIGLLQTLLKQEYGPDLEEAEKVLDKKQRLPLGQQLRETPSWRVYFGQRRAELSFAHHYVDNAIKKRRSKMWFNYTEKYSRELSTTDKDRYIDGDPVIAQYEEARLIVKELYDKFDSIVDGLISRGFALQKLAEFRIKDIEE